MTPRKQLTPRQKDTLRAIVLFTWRNRRQPSHAELREELGTCDVRMFILELERRGWIRQTGLARGLEIPEDVFEAIVKTGEVPEP
jgi:hypothetical protein